MADAALQRKLRQYLQSERLLGAEAVPVHRPAMVQEAALPANPPVLEATSPMPAEKPAGQSLWGGDLETAAAQDPRPPAAPPKPSLDRQTKISILQTMDETEVKGCRKCELCRGRTQTVFGEGDPDARILFIGEGPGQTEDEQGRPFVGRAGELLNNMIAAMGLKREAVYIANVVKCRPPNNRTPTPQEVDTCWDYLRRQIETIQPRVIVTLGGPATKKLLQTDRGITSIRGVWHTFATSPGAAPIPLMPTFHPAYLLRSYTPDNRRKVWSDLKKVMEAAEGK